VTRRGTVLPVVAMAAGLGLAVWGFDLAPRTTDAVGGGDLGVVPPATSITQPDSSSVPTTTVVSPATPPTRLVVPALHVDAPVDAVDAPAGDLEVPDDPARVGWWRLGATPGDSGGSALLAGHVDSAVDGPGALFHLDRLRPGDGVTVRTASRETRYLVAAVRHYVKADLPRDLADRSGPPRLVIVSCGGPFDHVHRTYLDNVVVYATPT
jgi:hypothetical protein